MKHQEKPLDTSSLSIKRLFYYGDAQNHMKDGQSLHDGSTEHRPEKSGWKIRGSEMFKNYGIVLLAEIA